jgi:AhpD family alkylhydroperoxidase
MSDDPMSEAPVTGDPESGDPESGNPVNGEPGRQRVPLVADDDQDPRLQAVFGRVTEVWPSIGNLYRTLGHSPLLLEKWIDFAWSLRHDSRSDRGLRELVIMRTAQLNATDYEWRHHYPMALEFGVTEEQLAELANWRSSELFSPLQRAVLAMAEELATTTSVSDATWDELSAHLDEVERIEVVLTAAFYACVSRVLGGLGVPLEPRYEEYPPVV